MLLYNSLTRDYELIDSMVGSPCLLGMYVCGPTVYDTPHIGNARSAVVYDILFRVLCHKFGNNNVIYVRNITDIDDKIIDASKSSGVDAIQLTRDMMQCYHDDVAAIGCLSPTHEPRVSDYIPNIISMIKQLIDNNHAYVADEHVLFNVASYGDYGALSRRNTDEMIAGARVEVAPYKRSPMDFVLWKPSKDGDAPFLFESPWGIGRPGWHIECSAMSTQLLGETFAIHGGGIDLIFPHHENEIAQSICALPGSKFAKCWVHNGFVTVDGVKMSKSLGNFHTVRDLLNCGVTPCALRYFYMTAHYRKPIDYTTKAIEDATKAVQRFYCAVTMHYDKIDDDKNTYETVDDVVIDALYNDMNMSLVLSRLHVLASAALTEKSNNDNSLIEYNVDPKEAALKLLIACRFLGLNLNDCATASSNINITYNACGSVEVHAVNNEDKKIIDKIMQFAEDRMAARRAKDWRCADELRQYICDFGYDVSDISHDGIDKVVIFIKKQ